MESSEQRDPVEVLAEQFAARCRAGENPSLDEYLVNYPQHAAAIQELFPSVAMLEQLRRSENSERESLERGQRNETLNKLPIESIDDYQIIREIGRGGMGIVYEALQRTLSRRVALKLLTDSAIKSRKQIHRFAREARSAAGLHHTNIVPVFGFGEFQGTYYYAMQFIDGVGLDEIIVALAEMSRNSATGTATTAEATGGKSSPRNSSAMMAAQALRDGNFAEPRKPGADAASSAVGSSSTTRRTQETQAAQGTCNDQQILPPPKAPSAGQSSAGQSTGGQSITDSDRAAPHIALTVALDHISERSNETDDFELPDSASGIQRSSAALTAGDARFNRSSPWAEQDAVPHTAVKLGMPYFRSVARVGVQIAEALAYAHANRVLHRDIKPSNLLIDAQGTAWITDFGLAKQFEQDDLTRTGDIVGTLRYMSPEQLDGRADARSDIYSLGLTLYELLILKPAFDATGHGRLIQQKTSASLVPLRKLNSRVPRDLETIILKCCAASPAHRYERAAEVAEDLQRFLEDRPILARRATVPERLWRWSRRNPAIAWSSAAAIVCLFAAIAFLTIGMRRTQDALETATIAQQQSTTAREQSEANLNLAIDAFERIFENIAARGVPQSLEMDFAGEDAPQFETVLTEADGELLKTLLAFHERFAQQNSDDDELQARNAAAYHRMGQIYYRLNRADDAEFAYQKAMTIYEMLLEKYPGESSYIINKAQTMNDIGELYRAHSMFNESFAAHRLARDFLENQSREVATQDPMLFELADTLDLLGSVVIRSGMRNVILQQRPEIRRLNQFRAFRKPGLDRPPFRDPGEAAPPFRDGARPPRPENLGQPGPPGDIRDPLGEVEKDLNRACRILEDLAARHPANTEYRLTQARANRHLLAHYLQVDRTEPAAAAFAAAHNILLQLVKEYPDEPRYLFDLADTLSLASARLPSMQTDDAANRYLSQAIEYGLQLTAKFPNVPEYQALLANTYGQLALVEQASGDFAGASSRLELARGKMQTLVERYPTQSAFQISWVLTEKQTADLRREIGQRDEDVFEVQASRDILLAAIERFTAYTQGRKDNPMFPRITSGLYLGLAESYRLLGDRVEAFIAIAEAQKQSNNPWQPSRPPFGPPSPNSPATENGLRPFRGPN